MLNASTPNAVTGKYLVLPLPGAAGDHDHARPGHRGSAGFERRVRLGEHVGRELARDELALRVDDAQPLEARALGGDPGSGELHPAALALLFVLGAVEVEIVDRGARDRGRLAHVRVHDGKDARFVAKRPVTAASSASDAQVRRPRATLAG